MVGYIIHLYLFTLEANSLKGALTLILTFCFALSPEQMIESIFNLLVLNLHFFPVL